MVMRKCFIHKLNSCVKFHHHTSETYIFFAGTTQSIISIFILSFQCFQYITISSLTVARAGEHVTLQDSMCCSLTHSPSLFPPSGETLTLFGRPLAPPPLVKGVQNTRCWNIWYCVLSASRLGGGRERGRECHAGVNICVYDLGSGIDDHVPEEQVLTLSSRRTPLHMTCQQ